MARIISPLRLGAKVCFEDRWQGQITAIDIAEDWEVLNVTVASGLLFASRAVKLPFSAVTSWTHDAVFINITSDAAFAREVPPVAAPSRPVSKETPVAHQGAHIAGFLVGSPDRRAEEVLIARGKTYRIPVASVTFDGKSLTLGQQFDNLQQFVPDDVLLGRVRDAIAESEGLIAADKLGIVSLVESGVAVLGGNARAHAASDRVVEVVRGVPGVVSVRNEIVDDMSLETLIGMTMDRTGIQRHAEIFARSNMGIVTIYGNVPTPRVAEDVAREIGRLKGVREVHTKLEVRPDPILPSAVA